MASCCMCHFSIQYLCAFSSVIFVWQIIEFDVCAEILGEADRDWL